MKPRSELAGRLAPAQPRSDEAAGRSRRDRLRRPADVDAARLPGRCDRQRDHHPPAAARRAGHPQPAVPPDHQRRAVPAPAPDAGQGASRRRGVAPLYTGMAKWKDPWTGDKRPLFVYGVVPYAPAIEAPGVIGVRGPACTRPIPACSTASRVRSSAQVAAKLAAGEPVEAEVNGAADQGRRHDHDRGQLRRGRQPGHQRRQLPPPSSPVGRPARSTSAWSGSARGRRAAGQGRAAQALRRDLLVLTIDEFIDREKDFLLRSRPINFIFTLGAARRLPRRLRDRLPGAVHRREQPSAAVRHAQGDRLLRRVPATRRAGRVADSVGARLPTRRGARLGPVRVRRRGRRTCRCG